MTGKGIARSWDGTYKGNVVADMQIFVAKAIHEGLIEDQPLLQTGKNQIPMSVVDWATTKGAKFDPEYRCNGDSMHHVTKGIAVIRVEGTLGFIIKDNIMVGITNRSFQPFQKCTDYHAKESVEESGQQGIGNIRGISISAFRPFFQDRNKNGVKGDDVCLVQGNTVRNLQSQNPGVVVGLDVQGESSGVVIKGNAVALRPYAVDSPNDKYIAMRIREHVSREQLLIGENSFLEDLVVLNRRNLRTEPAAWKHPDVSDEQKKAGCPFAS